MSEACCIIIVCIIPHIIYWLEFRICCFFSAYHCEALTINTCFVVVKRLVLPKLPGCVRGFKRPFCGLQTPVSRYYIRSGTGGRCCIGTGRRFVFTRQGSALFCVKITSWPPSWNYDVKSKIRLRQSMRIYLKNIPAIFHPDPIWNAGALGFFEEFAPTRTRWVAMGDQFLI